MMRFSIFDLPFAISHSVWRGVIAHSPTAHCRFSHSKTENPKSKISRTGCLFRCNHDCGQLGGLLEEGNQFGMGQKLAFVDQIQPETAFVGFFLHGSQFCNEFGLAAGSACRAIIGSDTRSGTPQLSPQNLSGNPLGQSFRHIQTAMGKCLGPLLQILPSHGENVGLSICDCRLSNEEKSSHAKRANRKSQIANSHAFTVLELLVATAVMAMLLVLLLQITNHTLQASKTATQQMDSTQSARQALDVLSSDIASALTTDGATLLTQTVNGAPSLAFLTAGRGPSSTPTRFLAVNYKLESNQLLRAYKAVDWSSPSLLAAAETASATPDSTSVLAEGILQFAVLAVLENGDMVSLLAPPANAAGASGTVLFEGQTVPTLWSALVPSRSPIPSPLNFNTARVRALLVAIASVDGQNFGLLSSGQRALFTNPSSSGPTSDPVIAWEAALQAGSVPSAARSAIRFHSKVIPLP
jgi:type II secretory pathway pseudopilin PulG